MKHIKRFSLVAILLVSTMAFSSVAMAWGPQPQDPSPPDYDHHHHHRTRDGQGGQAGAPLDGGLLAILAAAGIAYVGARKKKKNAE